MADFIPGHITVNNFNTLSDNVDSLLADASLEFIIDGGGSEITTGEKGHIMLPFHGIVSHVTLLADQQGSIQIDVWRLDIDHIANFPPTVADSITNGNPLAIVDAKYYIHGQPLWGANGLSMNKYDILAFNVDSVATITRCTIELSIRKYSARTRAVVF